MTGSVTHINGDGMSGIINDETFGSTGGSVSGSPIACRSALFLELLSGQV